MSEPLFIPCEGSGAISTYCPMCAWTPSALDPPGHKTIVIPKHDRMDVLAMLDRGDFDG